MNNLKKSITILCPDKLRGGGLHYFYSLFPLLRKKFDFVKFNITNSLNFCLKKDKNDSLLIVRYVTNDYKFNDIDTTKILGLLRDKYKNLAIFDDGDRTSIDFPQALPIVDVYFHSQIFSDFENYLKPLKRGQLYSDYYSKLGIKDKSKFMSITVDNTLLSKVQLAWNIGAGCYPRNNLLRKTGLIAAKILSPRIVSKFYNDPLNITAHENKELYDVHARFSIQSIPTIAYQRQLVLDKVSSLDNVLTGKVTPKQYNEEIKHSKIVLSPYGWGEVCFRDFEAILNKSLLMKPNMSHVNTWPDVYLPYETYVPFQWNAEDLNDKIEEYLNNDEKRKKISKNALDVYMNALNQLDDKVKVMVDKILIN
ncbi:MAG: hypothetical protein JJU37_17065 [Balneolaceae bacterium]|nr:hypothetical protein [Balneolaceae bacterium]